MFLTINNISDEVRCHEHSEHDRLEQIAAEVVGHQQMLAELLAAD